MDTSFSVSVLAYTTSSIHQDQRRETSASAGDDAEVVIEVTYGWYWAVDLLVEAGFSVHVAHPSGNDWGQRQREER